MNPAKGNPKLVADSATYRTLLYGPPAGPRETSPRGDVERRLKLNGHIHSLRTDCARLARATLFAATTLGCTLAAGCSSGPLPNTPASVDSAYGIPSGSVPANLRRPDGMLKNGLLPAQSNG